MKKILLGCLLILLCGSANAQGNCGGVHVGGGTCLPPDDPRLGGGQSSAPVAPVRWADRWGAIAADGNGTFGIVTNRTSKKKAEKAAIETCKERGGGNCTVDLSYYNQCAAVGANELNSFSFSGPDLQAIEARAVTYCEERTGKECRVYWSGCSTAVRIN